MKKNIIFAEEARMLALCSRFLDRYKDEIDVVKLSRADEVIDALNKNCPDALIMEKWLCHGIPNEIVNINIDPYIRKAGELIAKFLRKKYGKNIWIGLLTTEHINEIPKETQDLVLLNGNIYIKPYNYLFLENDLCNALGIKSKVPPESLIC